MAYLGEADCINYGGVKRITSKVCCGGVKREKVLLNCEVHKRIYADACKRRNCPYYVKGDSNARREG